MTRKQVNRLTNRSLWVLLSYRKVVHVMHSASVWILLVDTSASARRVTMVMGLKAVYLPTNVNLESTSATKPGLPVSTLSKAMNVTVKRL